MDESWRKGPVKLRYTGETTRPYIAVCERCGCDVDYEPRRSMAGVVSGTTRVSNLGRVAVDPGGSSSLFHP